MTSDRRGGAPVRIATLVVLLVTAALPPRVAADSARIAAATNFATVLPQLTARFQRGTSHALTISMGSTGKLFAQIVNGAPFDILLAADQERPERLEQAGLAVPDSRFTYAVGRLTLWSADPDRIGPDGVEALHAPFHHLAIANPDLAPYGRAARETLESLGLYAELADRLVLGENVGQAQAMIATGNAELGFVARSSLVAEQAPGGSRWDVPAALHQPIRQDAVLLVRAIDNAAARAFLTYLTAAEAQGIIRRAGYGID